MARHAMVTDLRKCVGCHACTVTCNAEWDVQPGQARTRVETTPLSGVFPALMSSTYVAQCNHCDEPSCVHTCPSGASYRDENGVVRVDEAVCIGCGFCVDACPYDARHISLRTKKADKCDFCAPRVARGEQPACVSTCPANAKHFGDLEDRNGDVHRMVFHDGARRIESDDIAVGPNVYYLGDEEHLDLVAASFVPRPPRLVGAAEAWMRFLRPFVLSLVGVTLLGQAVAFFTQLHKGEDDFDE
ncbi:MAG: 4Fe-4S dicluster domain-containing protein [Thermoanaerobaculia bacterium]